MSMDTDIENTTISEKTVDSQETISEENMFVTINIHTKKLESTIADPKFERSLIVRTPKSSSKDFKLIQKHNDIYLKIRKSENSEDVFGPVLIKRDSTIPFNQPNTKKQTNFDIEVNTLGPSYNMCFLFMYLV